MNIGPQTSLENGFASRANEACLGPYSCLANADPFALGRAQIMERKSPFAFVADGGNSLHPSVHRRDPRWPLHFQSLRLWGVSIVHPSSEPARGKFIDPASAARRGRASDARESFSLRRLAHVAVAKDTVKLVNLIDVRQCCRLLDEASIIPIGHRVAIAASTPPCFEAPSPVSTGNHIQYEFVSPNIVLIRCHALLATLSASLNFGDCTPSFPRTAATRTLASACCSYRRFNSSPSSTLTTLHVMMFVSGSLPSLIWGRNRVSGVGDPLRWRIGWTACGAALSQHRSVESLGLGYQAIRQ